jgi:hypothetical protein
VPPLSDYEMMNSDRLLTSLEDLLTIVSDLGYVAYSEYFKERPVLHIGEKGLRERKNNFI